MIYIAFHRNDNEIALGGYLIYNRLNKVVQIPCNNFFCIYTLKSNGLLDYAYFCWLKYTPLMDNGFSSFLYPYSLFIKTLYNNKR